ncbi:MAG: RNase adapter RapZ [Ruminococcaceae bacterium]|nr:RNase adapter RapZ [Oscillospiraceae bacterium]
MRFIIITGLSGAGKTQVIRCLEDLDYYCIDNMPPALIPKFAEICYSSNGKINKVAMVIDIRGGDMFNELFNELNTLKASGYNYEVLFLEANNEALVKRYKETRRMHPLARDGRLIDGIEKERDILEYVRKKANHILDTSSYTTAQLKNAVTELFEGDENGRGGIVINIQSFGFKYGIVLDGDLVFDVRFLPNPYYKEKLKNHTGLDNDVQEYVLKFEQTQEFVKRLNEMMAYLLPYYIEEGKSQLVIGIGCTGGKHRSVTIAIQLYNFLKENGYNAIISHRDILKDKY